MRPPITEIMGKTKANMNKAIFPIIIRFLASHNIANLGKITEKIIYPIWNGTGKKKATSIGTISEG